MKTFALRGTVVRGDGLGRQLGFPTANVKVSARRVPPFGVYRVEVRARGLGVLPGVCSVGIRPTLGGDKAPRVEVHIPGFSGDLYGRVLRVSFLDKLRDEKRFASLGALKSQIRRDVRKALAKGAESR